MRSNASAVLQLQTTTKQLHKYNCKNIWQKQFHFCISAFNMSQTIEQEPKQMVAKFLLCLKKDKVVTEVHLVIS